MDRTVRLTQASDVTPRRWPRVRVTVRPNPGADDAVLLLFAEDCPYCGKRHEHGNPVPKPDSDGTYGHRVEHCANHTHVLTASGRRARVTRDNLCERDHPGYILIPAEAVS